MMDRATPTSKSLGFRQMVADGEVDNFLTSKRQWLGCCTARLRII